MLVEDMHRLPIGTRVRSVKLGDERLVGSVESGLKGMKYVRWSDGTRTVDFGTIRENDEYIASYLRIDCGSEATRHTVPVNPTPTVKKQVRSRCPKGSSQH
jgi:hypothetical protein